MVALDNVSMRVRVDNSSARTELGAALIAAGCPALLIGKTLEIDPLPGMGDEVTVRFFVLAWRARYPEAGIEILG